MLDLPVIGWREWLALPDLELPAIKAKIDTGARSSSLHVAWIEASPCAADTQLRFAVSPGRRNAKLIVCEALAHDRRAVADSGGHVASRWFIRSRIELAGLSFVAEINLTDRCSMQFPMLLGRSALRGRFRVDPGIDYACGRRRGGSRIAADNP